jgi:hypothetical protein
VNVQTGSTLAGLDVYHKGHLTESDLKAAVHKMQLMRKLVVMLSILVLVFVACTFGAIYVAIMLTREVHVKGSRLTDNDGNSISTKAQVEKIDGVVDSSQSRRLQASSSSSAFEISQSYVMTTIGSYSGGQVDWVVPLPDNTVRTVHIQGTDGETSAWGRCDSCEGAYSWHVTCKDSANSSNCPITTWLPTEARRLGSVTESDQRDTTKENLGASRSLLSRRLSGDDDEKEVLDRALGDKQCI